MKESIQIANTILSQIKAIDFWTLGAWGAHDVFALKDGKNDDVNDWIRGGLAFKIRTPKYMQSHYVTVYLMGSDTYNVSVIKCNFKGRQVVAMVDDVYCDQLVEVIDSLIDD